MIFLETKRTILRPFEKDDLSSLSELMTDPEVMKFTGFRKPQSLEKIKECLEAWVLEGIGPLGVWCAVEKKSKDFVGWFMLKDTGQEYPEIGFMLSKKKWGKGFATEVSEEIINYAFNELDFKKIIAKTVSENSPSIAVLKKLGMVKTEINYVEDSNYQILRFEVWR